MELDETRKVLCQLVGLLKDEDFHQEARAYRCAYQRLKVRLRNNIFMSKLKQLSTMMYRIRVDLPPQTLEACNKQIISTKSDVQRHGLKSLRSTLVDFIQRIDAILDKTLQIYSHTQPHLKVGHLIHHLIVIRSSIARLRACYKALLVYLTDLFIEIDQFCQKFTSKDPMTVDDVKRILRKNQIKLRPERPKNRPDRVDTDISSCPTKVIKNETIGQLVDRNTYRTRSKK